MTIGGFQDGKKEKPEKGLRTRHPDTLVERRFEKRLSELGNLTCLSEASC
jgi:hypothetical protein